jgi:hypothetical protein
MARAATETLAAFVQRYFPQAFADARRGDLGHPTIAWLARRAFLPGPPRSSRPVSAAGRSATHDVIFRRRLNWCSLRETAGASASGLEKREQAGCASRRFELPLSDDRTPGSHPDRTSALTAVPHSVAADRREVQLPTAGRRRLDSHLGCRHGRRVPRPRSFQNSQTVNVCPDCGLFLWECRCLPGEG